MQWCAISEPVQVVTLSHEYFQQKETRPFCFVLNTHCRGLSAERSGQTFFAEQDVGLDIPHTGQCHDPPTQHPFKVADIPRHDPQTIIVDPEDMLDRLHL